MKEKKFDMEALNSIEDVSESELIEITGASGVVTTLTHECKMNSLQFLGTSCGW